jgi:carboxypeptidase D
MEIGPFRVKGENLVENDGSWNEFANLLFGTQLWRKMIMVVDQPVGTGFSYVNTDSYIHELPEVLLFTIPY